MTVGQKVIISIIVSLIIIFNFTMIVDVILQLVTLCLIVLGSISIGKYVKEVLK